MNERTSFQRFALGLTLLAVAILAWHGPIAQSQAYHAFADHRTLFGLPNFWNFVTNLPILLAGLAGLAFLWRYRHDPRWRPGRDVYCALFVSLALTGLGSAWYHWAPSDATLVWDRLPLSALFLCFFAALWQETLGKLNPAAKLGLLLAGPLSVLFWLGTGDLRVYGLIQFVPMLLMPILLASAQVRGTAPGLWWWVLGAYAVAKVLEALDSQRLQVIGFSGHALKHLLAAAASALLVAHLAKRRSARERDVTGTQNAPVSVDLSAAGTEPAAAPPPQIRPRPPQTMRRRYATGS